CLLQTRPCVITPFGQSANIASILPSAINGLQDVISPSAGTPGAMISVRTSAAVAREFACGSASGAGEGGATDRNSSVVFQTGSVGFSCFFSATSAGLPSFASSRADELTWVACRV